MTGSQPVAKERDHPPGKVAAFFDMDRTVVRTNTGPMYLSYAFRHGWLRKRHIAIGAWWTLLYKLTMLDTASAARRATTSFAGLDERALTDFCRTWVAEDVLPEISSSARRVIERHRRRGDVLVMLTASTNYGAGPVAEHLEMDHLLSTRLEARDGRLTGRAVEPLCIGEGKVHWAERLAEEHGLDLGRSSFYTDSIDDKPMLERVGEPVVVNPDFRLARLARSRRWRVERWR